MAELLVGLLLCRQVRLLIVCKLFVGQCCFAAGVLHFSDPLDLSDV